MDICGKEEGSKNVRKPVWMTSYYTVDLKSLGEMQSNPEILGETVVSYYIAMSNSNRIYGR